MALSVSRWRNLESESSKAVVILMSCIAVMVVTTLRGVPLIYSHDTMLIGVTEPIKTNEWYVKLETMSSSVCRAIEVEASSIVSTKLLVTMAMATLRRSNARRASSKLAACLW